jgi:hypothetical protein
VWKEHPTVSSDLLDPPASAAGSPGGIGERQPFLRANRVALVGAPVTVALAATVYLASPNEHGLDSLWQLLFHLTPFVAALVTIAYLDHAWMQRLRLHLVLPALCFLIFYTFFVSHNFIYHALDDFDSLYYNQLMMVPFIILTLVLCVRLGGARRSVVARLGIALLLIQLSGVEDLSFLVWGDYRDQSTVHGIPEVWDWADHIAVRIGDHPTAHQAYVFIAVHLALAALVLLLPDRMFRAIRDRVRPPRPATSVDA